MTDRPPRRYLKRINTWWEVLDHKQIAWIPESIADPTSADIVCETTYDPEYGQVVTSGTYDENDETPLAMWYWATNDDSAGESGKEQQSWH